MKINQIKKYYVTKRNPVFFGGGVKKDLFFITITMNTNGIYAI